MSKIKFGTAGWRAIIAEDFTFQNVRIAVAAIARFLKASGTSARGVVVAADNRFLSEEFMRVAVEVLAGHDIRSYLCPIGTPTPAVSYESTRRKSAGSINFTASHNPAIYQGLKFDGPNGGPAPVEVTSVLESLAAEIALGGAEVPSLRYDQGVAKGLISSIDPKGPYLARIREIVRLDVVKSAHMRVVADLMHGNAVGYLDLLLKEAGVELRALHSERDPLFGGHRPDPGADELGEAVGMVRSWPAQLGLACDGDADRFGVIDSDGTFITPNEVLAILFEHLVKARSWKGSVVRTVATTQLIDAIAKEHGISVVETPVGFKYIAEAMEKQAIIIGGEESGGLTILGHVLEKDGILACLLIAEVVAARKTGLGEILRELRQKHGEYRTGRIDVELRPGQRERIVASLKSSPPRDIGGLRVLETVTRDGMKFVLSNNAWVLIRFSGTEPLVRCYAEAQSRGGLEGLLSATKHMMDESSGEDE